MMPAARSGQRDPVVVGGESLNGLGIVRSPSGHGIEMHVVATTHWCAPALSRFAQLERIADLDDRTPVDALKALAKRLGRHGVLMPGGDRQVDIVNDHRDELEPLFQFTLPPAETLRMLANKASFQQFAQAHDLAVPRTAVVNGGDERLAALRDLALPLVLKPADKRQVLSGRAERAVRVDTLAQAESAATRMLAGSDCIVVQEWIAGGDADICFALFVCDHGSQVRAMFCGRKLVCDPPDIGSTGICVTVRQGQTLRELHADRVIAATGFKIDLERLDFLDPALASSIVREGARAPLLDRHYQTSVPGLHGVGAASAPTFGPVMRFMVGAKHAAPTLARALRA